MPISDGERRFIDEVSLTLPWSLVETFSRMPRWRPEDVNRGADAIVTSCGMPGFRSMCTNRRYVCRSRYSASVTVGNTTYRAKPPSSSLPVPEGRRAQAGGAAGQSARAAQL